MTDVEQGYHSGDTRRRLAWDGLAAILVLASAGVWRSAKWLDLFPLIEFRQQLYFRHIGLSFVIENATFRGTNIFPIPLYFNNAVGLTCGSSISCYNGALLGLNLISGLLLFVFVLRLFRSRTLACTAAVLFLVGLPVVDSMSWQATNFDKLSTLFVLAGLNLGLLFYRRPHTPSEVIIANLSLFVAAVLALNSKPAAFVMIPALLLMPIVGGGQKIVHWISNLVVPVGYGAAQMARVTWLVGHDAYYSEHVYGGNPFENIKRFIGILTGSTEFSWFAVVVFATMVALIMAGLVQRLPAARIGAWAFICTLGALALPARTVFATIFYMLVPSALFAVSVAAVVQIAWRLAGGRRVLIGRIGVALFAIVYTLRVFPEPARYQVVQSSSDHFREAVPVIATNLPQETQGQVIAVVGDSNYLGYQFFDLGDLEQYIYGTKTDLDDRISMTLRSKFDPAASSDQASYLFFGDLMSLQRIVVHGQEVWTSQ